MKLLVIIPAVVLALAPATLRAQEQSKSGHVAAQMAGQWSWHWFQGTDVVAKDGKKIGEVQDLIFDKKGSIVAYVVGVGGFLGIGSKNVAFPPGAFAVIPRGKGNIVLKLDKGKEETLQMDAFVPCKWHNERLC